MNARVGLCALAVMNTISSTTITALRVWMAAITAMLLTPASIATFMATT
jgi:hypothetical protein